MKTKIQKLSLAIIGLLITASVAFAQPNHGKRHHEIPDVDQVKKMVDQLAEELSLTAKQKKKISALYVAHFEEIRADQQKNKIKKEAQKVEHEQFRDEFFASVKSELKEDQSEKFVAFTKKHKPQKPERKKERSRK